MCRGLDLGAIAFEVVDMDMAAHAYGL